MEINRIKLSSSTNFTALHIIELAELPNTRKAIEEIVQTVRKTCPDCFIGTTPDCNGQGIRIATGTTEKTTRNNKKITAKIVEILNRLGFKNTFAEVVAKYQTYNLGEHGYGIPRTLDTGNIALDLPPLSEMLCGNSERLRPETMEEFSATGEFVSSIPIRYKQHLRLVQ